MQRAETVLRLLGIEQYTKLFENAGFLYVDDIQKNLPEALRLISNRRQRDTLEGYLQFRSDHQSDVDRQERRADAYASVRAMLTKLSELQSKKSSVYASGAENRTGELSNLLDEIEGVKEQLVSAQQQLEASMSRKPESIPSRRPSSSLGKGNVGRPNTARSAEIPPLYSRNAPLQQRNVFSDPNSWNCNERISRMDFLARKQVTRGPVRVQNELQIVGQKANAISLGVNTTQRENDQMLFGATTVKNRRFV